MNGNAQSGLTLVEVLAAITLIGLFSTLVAVNVSPPGPNVDRATERLAADFRRASRHAVISGEMVAWNARSRAYFAFRSGNWHALPDPDPRGGDTARLRVELLASEAGQEHVVFAPTGEASAARLRIGVGSRTRELIVNASGRIAMAGQE